MTPVEMLKAVKAEVQARERKEIEKIIQSTFIYGHDLSGKKYSLEESGQMMRESIIEAIKRRGE